MGQRTLIVLKIMTPKFKHMKRCTTHNKKCRLTTRVKMPMVIYGIASSLRYYIIISIVVINKQ